MMTESLAYPGDTRRLSVGEEVLNAVSHGVGALLAVAGTVLLVLRAKAYGGLVNLVGVTVFGVSMILLYLFSCLYHALPPSKGKQVFQVLDHCSIFLLIMGTYAPVCLTFFGAIYLGIVAILPIIAENISGIVNISIGGTSVIIVVGVALETVKMIEAQMLMRHYKGFLE